MSLLTFKVQYEVKLLVVVCKYTQHIKMAEERKELF